MTELKKGDIQKLLASELEKLGLTRLAKMFAVEHNVPRGTHKAEAGSKVGNADTLDGHHAADFAMASHTHPGMITGSYDDDYKALFVSSV